MRSADIIFTMPFIYPWSRSRAAEPFLYERMDHDYRKLPPGRYRVCFRYWQGSLTTHFEKELLN